MKTLSEIKMDLAFKNACHEDDFIEGWDAAVEQMKLRAEVLVEAMNTVADKMDDPFLLDNALEAYRKSIGEDKC